MRHAQPFPRRERGSVAIESALALVVLIGAFAALMHVVGTVYADDRLGRAARAAARALALDAAADPWAALRRELGLSAGADCPAWSLSAGRGHATCGGWTLEVVHGISPAALGTGTGVTADGGELVLVRLSAPAGPWSVGGFRAVGDGSEAAADTNASKAVAIGLARCEPAA